ncbi:hypothetical protein L3X38_006150 [Prunus dulcis]|uniref:Uncharacterized protein n=1 Tax=Prunus dulcis TaxID=3755 RepID=A0AAD4ZS08_PRUDU|nr:hypothetical protein L3X38_006150 [Prunus dulcis]
MSYMRRCLERQERAIEEGSCKRAEEQREEEEDDEQVAMAVGMLHLSSQSYHHGSQVGRGPNVDRRWWSPPFAQAVEARWKLETGLRPLLTRASLVGWKCSKWSSQIKIMKNRRLMSPKP